LTFLGKAIRVHSWGLDPVGWAISVGIGSLSLIIAVFLKLIPLEKILPGGGSKEITKQELNRMSTMNLRKAHNSGFYQSRSRIMEVGRRESFADGRNQH